MAEWRIGRGWTEEELEARLAHAHTLPRNFTDPVERMTTAHGWNRYYSQAVIAKEPPGPPVDGGPFARGCTAIANYQFSDPRIVIAHFVPDAPLLGRHMLLELQALRVLHYLSGVVVSAVRDETVEEGEGDPRGGPETVFGFRYDTLDGHIERGVEWFLLTKAHATGEIRFRIEASWLPGQFPNWWSRLGFSILGPYHQRIWHHHAHALMAQLVRDPNQPPPEPTGEQVVHMPPEVVFKRFKAEHA